MISLDDIDRRILAALERDGRISMVQLSELVGLSPTPCMRRVKRLEEEDVIERYVAVINRAKLGRSLQAFVQVSLADHAEETVAAFQKALLERPEVVSCWATSGATDFVLHVVTSDLEAYGAFALKELLRMPGVKDTRSSFVLATLK